MEWKRIFIVFGILAILGLVFIFIAKWWVWSSAYEIRTNNYEIKGYESELKHNNLDSAIYYHRLATLVPENKQTEDARFALARAFYDKARELHKDYEWFAEQRKKDTVRILLKYYAHKDSARAVYNALNQKNANPKRLFVLEQLILNDDDSYAYHNDEDKIYHVGR